MLVPASALAEAARTADGDPVGMHLLTGPDGATAVAGFGFGGQALTIRLTGGEYPDVVGLIPAGFTATAVIDAAGLAETVKRRAVVAARGSPVRLAFTPGQVTLTAAAATRPTAPTPSAASWTATRSRSPSTPAACWTPSPPPAPAAPASP